MSVFRKSHKARSSMDPWVEYIDKEKYKSRKEKKDVYFRTQNVMLSVFPQQSTPILGWLAWPIFSCHSCSARCAPAPAAREVLGCFLSFNARSARAIWVVHKRSATLVSPFAVCPERSPHRCMVIDIYYRILVSLITKQCNVNLSLPSSWYLERALAFSWPLITRPVREYST